MLLLCKHLFSLFVICLIHFLCCSSVKRLPAISTGLHNALLGWVQNRTSSWDQKHFRIAQLFHIVSSCTILLLCNTIKYIGFEHRAINFITYFLLIATQPFKLFSDLFSHFCDTLKRFRFHLLIAGVSSFSIFLRLRFFSVSLFAMDVLFLRNIMFGNRNPPTIHRSVSVPLDSFPFV